MGRKSLVCLNIAVIGKCAMAESIAKCFARAGHNIFIGQKEHKVPGRRKSDNISHTTIESAAIIADVIILAVPMDEVREVAYMLGDIRRKIIVDATSFNFTRFGQHVDTYHILQSITGNHHVVKCYNKTGYEDLVDDSFDCNDIDVFMAGESKKSKELVKLLAKEIKIGQCYDFGGSDIIPTLDEMTICWQTHSVNNTTDNAVPARQQRR